MRGCVTGSLEDIIKGLAEVLGRNDRVLFAFLFGSYARGMAGPLSDLDVAIFVEGKLNFDELGDLVCSIASRLGINEDKIDIVVLDDETPYELRFKVFKDGIPIVVKDEKVFKEYRDKSLSLYWDFKVFKEKLDLDRKYLEALKRLFHGRSTNET